MVAKVCFQKPSVVMHRLPGVERAILIQKRDNVIKCFTSIRERELKQPAAHPDIQQNNAGCGSATAAYLWYILPNQLPQVIADS